MTTVNLEALGYSQAQSSDSLEDRAREAMGAIAGFPEKISEEAKTALYAGYTKRFNEKNPPVTYAVIDGNYVQATPEMVSNKKVEKIEIGVHFAMSFSTHEYGRLTKDNPKLRAIVEGIRSRLTTYCSNRLGDLKKKAKEIIKQGQTGPKREAKDFDVSVKDQFDAWEKSVKTKQSRGDKTADPLKFKMAVSAFWKAYKA